MRVVAVHSFYRSDQPSGENVAVVQQVEAMRRGGMEVTELFRYTDEEQRKPVFGLKSATSALTGIDWGQVKKSLDWRTIDVVNVHNTLPNFGTRWLSEIDTPVVTTIHNFRFTCANGLLYRQGAVCTECVAAKPWPAIRHGCYQGSRSKTLPVALGPRLQGSTFPVIRSSRAVIAQTERVAQALLQVGVDESRIARIPGFVEDLGSPVTAGPTEPRFVFVGRATPEKGLQELLAIWPQAVSLDVYGADATSAGATEAGGETAFKGAVDRETIRGLLGDYTALVFPGRVWEGALPLVVREALEAGLPVVALEGSSAADFIADTGAGEVYLDGDSHGLNQILCRIAAHEGSSRKAARRTFQDRLSENSWFSAIHALFGEVAA